MITYKSSIIYFPSKKEDQCCDNYYFNSKTSGAETDGARVRLSQKSAKGGRQVFGICSGNYESFMDKSPVYAAFDKLKKYHSFYIKKEDTNVEKLLKNYFREATVDVAASTEGTVALPKVSMAVVALDGENVTVANAGNVKVFCVKNGAAAEISKEHTQARRMADMGIIPEQKLKAHPQRKRLTRYLGGGADAATPSITGLKCEGDETFIILSSSFFDFVDKETLVDAVESASEPADIAAYVMSAYLSEDIGDFTAIVIKAFECENVPEEVNVTPIAVPVSESGTKNTASAPAESTKEEKTAETEQKPAAPVQFVFNLNENKAAEEEQKAGQPETKAPETKIFETKVPETKAPETKAPEIKTEKTEEETKPSENRTNAVPFAAFDIKNAPNTEKKVNVVISAPDDKTPFDEEVPGIDIGNSPKDREMAEQAKADFEKKLDGNMIFDWSEVDTETATTVIASQNAVEIDDESVAQLDVDEKAKRRAATEALNVKIEDDEPAEPEENAEETEKVGLKEAVKRFMGTDMNGNDEDEGKTLWPTVIIFALSLLIVILLLFFGIKMIGKNKDDKPSKTPAPTAAATEAPRNTEEPSDSTEEPSDATETPADVTPEATDANETAKPTTVPTNAPTNAPTKAPTAAPTKTPEVTPTTNPSETPADETPVPGEDPTAAPSETPEESATTEPTETPDVTPTEGPSETPEVTPTEEPSESTEPAESDEPTPGPTTVPEATEAAPTETPESTPEASPEEAPEA